MMKHAKGYFGRRKKCLDSSQKTLLKKVGGYAYRDRKAKKRTFRGLWIQRINAGARLNGMSYSKFMGAAGASNIELNRKVLADLAMNHPETFAQVVKAVK